MKKDQPDNLPKQDKPIPWPLDEWVRLAMDTSDTYWWELDLLTNQARYSPNASRILGQSPAPTLEANLVYVHPEDRAIPAQVLQQALQTGTDRLTYQVRSVAHPNQLRWFEVTGKIRRDDQGQPTLIAGQAQNITATQQAQTESYQSQAQATFLLELSDALRSLADTVTMQLTATRLALDYFGADRAYYCEVDGQQVTVRQHAARPDLPAIPPFTRWSSSPA